MNFPSLQTADVSRGEGFLTRANSAATIDNFQFSIFNSPPGTTGQLKKLNCTVSASFLPHCIHKRTPLNPAGTRYAYIILRRCGSRNSTLITGGGIWPQTPG